MSFLTILRQPHKHEARLGLLGSPLLLADCQLDGVELVAKSS